MKIEITNDFLKKLEKALRKEVAITNYCEIQNITIDFIEGVFYTVDVHWGNEKNHENHDVKLYFNDSDSIDFIRGQFSRVIYELDVKGEFCEWY